MNVLNSSALRSFVIFVVTSTNIRRTPSFVSWLYDALIKMDSWFSIAEHIHRVKYYGLKGGRNRRRYAKKSYEITMITLITLRSDKYRLWFTSLNFRGCRQLLFTSLNLFSVTHSISLKKLLIKITDKFKNYTDTKKMNSKIHNSYF